MLVQLITLIYGVTLQSFLLGMPRDKGFSPAAYRDHVQTYHLADESLKRAIARLDGAYFAALNAFIFVIDTYQPERLTPVTRQQCIVDHRRLAGQDCYILN
jgi:hypothetical protein